MKIIYHEEVKPQDLPTGAIAKIFVSCLEINNVNACAKTLIKEISDTSWISELNPVGRMSYKATSLQTIAALVDMFSAVDNEITSDFGEFMISMSSGHYMKDKHGHQILPLSELWKEKKKNNHGFDFHTLSPGYKFSFGESKFVSNGNSYGDAAEQIYDFIGEEKDKRDAVHLAHFGCIFSLKNLEAGKRGFIVAFSMNSNDHEKILMNSLANKHIKLISGACDELYIIGVKSA